MADRWIGHRSDFQWEEDALKHVRDLMPDTDPYHAWSTFTFTGQSGHVREVDLFIVTPGGLFLVEIKSHPGTAINDGPRWIFRDGRTRAIDNPLHLADLKAKELKSRLERAVRDLGLNIRIPWIEPAVFLSAPNLVCGFDEIQRVKVYGRQGLTAQTTLPGIWDGLHQGRGGVTPQLSRELNRLLDRIGVTGLRKRYKIGPFELERRSFDTGPTWADFLASSSIPGDELRRVRVYLSELGATEAARESTRRAARREYLSLRGINHDGIVQAEVFSEEHEAGPAIVFPHGPDWQRLDHLMSARQDEFAVETRVEMIRQLAEAVDHAHRRHLYHRALAARSVWVHFDGRYPRLKIADWQTASRPHGTGLLGSDGTSLAQHVELSAAAYLAPEFGTAEADGVLLDVFGLGAISHLILTGQPPAQDRAGLAQRLRGDHALVPSAVDDAITASMDSLVRGATRTQAIDRFESVREFLAHLDDVEAELSSPGEPESDPLDAVRGSRIGRWAVEKILGKGSTARAFLTTTGEVLKVALSDSAAARLVREADQLRKLGDSHIVRLIEGPLEISGRTLIVLEQAGERTLAEYLREVGRLGINELQSLGDHLLDALVYLDGEDVRHRDIKPENIGVRELTKKGRRLVLFDFSLAEASESATRAGTPPYLDPFIGDDRRPYFDKAAEWYAAAVTLHQMASNELPSWGDAQTAPGMLQESTPQLAEGAFDPVLRDRLVSFFERALHREVSQRFPTLTSLRRGWSDVFHGLDAAEPITTPNTALPTSDDPEELRDAVAAAVRLDTPVNAAGLTERALSIALHQLEVHTVGELIRVPAQQIMRLRGVGLGPKNELVRRARQWRRSLGLLQPAPGRRSALEHDLAHLTVEEAAELLVPRPTTRSAGRVSVVRLALRIPVDGTLPTITPWAANQEIAEYSGLKSTYVATVLAETRERWSKSVPVTTALRRDVAEILAENGRIMEAGQVAAALLTRRGSDLDDESLRLAYAAACVRAAIETEEKLDNPRLKKRRLRRGTGRESRMLVALNAGDDQDAPSEEELLDYAQKLGDRADTLAAELSARQSLPSPTATLRALRTVSAPQGMAPLADTSLVTLAAAVSKTAAVSPRLELYPRDLSLERALVLAQVVGALGAPGATPEQLVERVLARFPELDTPPEPAGIRPLLLSLGYTIEVTTDGRLQLPTGTQVSRLSDRRSATSLSSTLSPSYGAADEILSRLRRSAERGGFLTLKVAVRDTLAVRGVLRTLASAPDGAPQGAMGSANLLGADVTAVDVTAEFVGALRAIRDQRGWPGWDVVTAADIPDADPDARAGFGIMTAEALLHLERRIDSIGGATLLTDATPLARYSGGLELLARLAARARQSGENGSSPRALWLLCPMSDPQRPPTLDNHGIGVLPGDAEQLVVPGRFARALGAARRPAFH
ncbi:BREX system serine/threonine kinase PglW [Nonomuraea candida]|uniref:BREX system serine/threonine kinase PglW n=1 Tax=Nonomuraea candida TaxID=359159 RepID=UPI000694C2BE|nr:BREX system serine/threonine kinase PglW [Nonomuraea candida]